MIRSRFSQGIPKETRYQPSRAERANHVQDERGKVAKAEANRVLHVISNQGIQLHGGIGMTDEYDIGFYVKRARVLEASWGSTSYLKDRFAKLGRY